MEQLKEWIAKHRALAIGGGFAFVVLLYLWLRSGSSAQAPQGGSAVNAYYAAQAAAAGDSAAVSQSTNQLQASSLQTQAARDVALAQVAAASTPYQLQLQAITQQQNLMAYQDFLAETARSGPATGNGSLYTNAQGVQFVQTNDAYSIYDLGTGSFIHPGSAEWNSLVPGTQTAVNWKGPGSAPLPVTQPSPITFQQFVNANPPTIH